MIIAGAGASGLSLLWFFLHSELLKKKRVLLIDRTLEPVTHKTWCFWSDKRGPFDSMLHHTWKSLKVGLPDKTNEKQLSRYQYHCIRSEDFTSQILSLTRQHKNVTLIEADINSFTSSGNMASAHTSKGEYKAPWIFQSTLTPPGFDQAKVDVSLMQHFSGWEIETSNPVFDPETATFMDFNTPQKNGLTFFYVLPYSEHHALIEYTLFSSELLSEKTYETAISNYMEQNLNLSPGSYTIARKEKGVIPMEDRRYPKKFTHRVINMGTLGGLTKPSTGYTFTRIHRHSRSITQALESGENPPLAPDSPYRYRVYDMLLLWILANKPETGVHIFQQLFKNNSLDELFSFLDEDTRLMEDLKILSSVPPAPFLKAIWKMKHRIFTGA